MTTNLNWRAAADNAVAVNDRPGLIPVQSGSSRSGRALALAGRHLLLASGCSGQAEGPGVNALAVHLEAVGARVSVLPSGSLITDLLGRRVIGRPDLVIAILPGRAGSVAAVRVAERIGSPLLALVASDEPGTWGHTTTLRRASRIAVTSTTLREQVLAQGAHQDRVELWSALAPSALAEFDQIAVRALRGAPGMGRR